MLNRNFGGEERFGAYSKVRSIIECELSILTRSARSASASDDWAAL